MKLLSSLIALSLAANVALGVWWLKARSASTPTAASPSASPVSSDGGASVKVATARESLPNAATLVAGTAAATPSWKELQTEDLKEFIRRLRAAGCPEETVQDIIVAEVNRRYAARTRELWPERFKQEQEPFWKTQKRNYDPVEQKKNRELQRKDRELRKEKSALLVELLGVDPEKQRRKEEGWDEPTDWQESRIAFLPEFKRAAVLKYLEEFEDKMQEFYARNQGLWDTESRAEQRKLEAEKLQGLAQFLTPQELREYELRQSQLASQLSHDLRSLTLTREQYEAIFDARKKYGDGIYNYGDIETKEAGERVAENKKSLQVDLAAALGPEKAKEYERSQDYSYQQLARLAKRYDLPADTVTKVYDYKETAEQSAKQLREDKNLSSEQRQQALQQIRTEAEKTLQETLGAANYKRYLREGGWWMNSLAPPPRPKPKP